ncbi:MAG: DPP IV N-terminal domain-containing protein [Gemmatimonadales bacterium]
MRLVPGLAGVALLLPLCSLAAQVSANDYARAEAFLPWQAQTLISGTDMAPRWLEGDRFWFRARRLAGSEFILVDPARGTRAPVFDHDRLAAALSVAADTAYLGNKLPFTEFDFVENGAAIQFQVRDSLRWTCRITTYVCTGPDSAAARPRHEIRSPDGKWDAYEKDENLWVRSVATGEEIQLSKDGEKDYGYAVVPEGCCQEITNRRRKNRPPPVLKWSPDSKRIATHRYDERRVESLNLLEALTGRPKLHSYHYALPGDSIIPMFDAWVFDVERRTGVKVALEPQPGNFTAADSVFPEVQWTKDAATLFYTRRSRDFKRIELHAVDPANGTARSVLTESGPTYRELNQFPLGGNGPNWRPLANGREVLWWSERDGWGHLYRFDATGKLINQVTRGPWLVHNVLHVDETGGWVYFTAVGREAEIDPYYDQLYRVRLDGTGLTRLSPEATQHNVWPSPSGAYFVDQSSRRDLSPTTVVRAPDGRSVLTVETSDVSPLEALGWKPPVPFRAKARDGVTEVYGYLYFPTKLDSTKRYPVIDYIYPGPQVGSVFTRGFTVGPPGNGHALAELGFVVFTVDAMGSPLRSKAFHDAYYANMTDNGIPDHISALRELAQRYPFMDLDRVGIFGHSGGGFSGTDAILSYPDFFKVAVSGAGNHDNRGYHFPWGEKYHGLLEKKPGGGDSYDSQANQNKASNLKGKLLLTYGTLDDNVHPNMTLLVADALIRANKTFDMLVFPNRNHGYANEPYVVRRTWDYFVQHLLGETPPADYEIRSPPR